MTLFDASGNTYRLEKDNSFNYNQTVGLYENKIDGVVHRFYYLIDSPSVMHVQIRGDWYKFTVPTVIHGELKIKR